MSACCVRYRVAVAPAEDGCAERLGRVSARRVETAARPEQAFLVERLALALEQQGTSLVKQLIEPDEIYRAVTLRSVMRERLKCQALAKCVQALVKCGDLIVTLTVTRDRCCRVRRRRCAVTLVGAWHRVHGNSKSRSTVRSLTRS